MTRYQVDDRTQVNIAGTLHEPGATVDLDDTTAAPLVRHGWLRAVEDDTPKPTRTTKARR